MKWQDLLLLTLAGLAVTATVAAFQHVPGYMDADYYYAVALQLAGGRGFTEPFVWNYLDDPARLPHPAFSYWMPLASLLAAAGAALGGLESWFSARIAFLAVAAAIPAVTAALAWSLSSSRSLSLTSGLLAAFSCYYLPYLSTTDTVGLYMLLGAGFFLLLSRALSFVRALLLGALTGLMHLARVDGLLWLLIAWIAVFMVGGDGRKKAVAGIGVLAGYLLVMVPWFARNHQVFASLLAPGGSRALWLTSYEQLFAYPAQQLGFASWWDSGLGSILEVRLEALEANLTSLLAAQGAGFLVPLIPLGLWQLRRDARIHLAILASLLLLAAMTVLFPFAGAQGGYFHSAAALQPLWWALGPIGLERVVDWTSTLPRWNMASARPFLRGTLVGMAAVLSAGVVYKGVLGGDGAPTWAREQATYRRVHELLTSRSVGVESVVMVANPPGFYLASGNAAIAVPYAPVEQVVMAAQHFHATYLVLELGSVPTPLVPMYKHPRTQACFTYLGEVEQARVFSLTCAD